ncbi:hypothetical protein [Salinisphaera shabanensis]
MSLGKIIYLGVIVMLVTLLIQTLTFSPPPEMSFGMDYVAGGE